LKSYSALKFVRFFLDHPVYTVSVIIFQYTIHIYMQQYRKCSVVIVSVGFRHQFSVRFRFVAEHKENIA